MTKEYKDFLFVEVPEDGYNFRVIESANGKNPGLFWSDGTPSPPWIILPQPISYSIVGMSGQLGEEEAKGIVDSKHSVYFENGPDRIWKDYSDNIYRLDTATESLASLIESLGLKPETTLILKKC